jgi:poly(3-hydroxybutyrate) depolymerase
MIGRGRTRGCKDGFATIITRIGFLCAIVFLNAKPGVSASLQSIDDFGPNPGNLNMYVYVPDGHEPKPAMVIALHGCVQQASTFDDETGLTKFADKVKFLLLLPEQPKANNEYQCFNWFQTEDNQKNQGESGSIRNMIQYMIDTYDVNVSRIFVLGLSAGGSMTSVLMANYPELFHGGAIIAGTPYGCNNPTLLTSPMYYWLNMVYGDAAAASYACGLFNFTPTQRSAGEWGDFVRASSGVTPDAWPKVSSWQGGADSRVNPANQSELIKQWTDVLGIDQTPDQSERFNNIQHDVYWDASNTPRLETYKIVGLDHAIAVDPGPGPEQCGVAADYIVDADICTSLKILEFWGVSP